MADLSGSMARLGEAPRRKEGSRREEGKEEKWNDEQFPRVRTAHVRAAFSVSQVNTNTSKLSSVSIETTRIHFIMDVLQKTVVDPLQPLLKPIIEAFPQPVHDAIISLITAPCHAALLLDMSLVEDPVCTSLAISKALGIAIVGASAVVKVPQILKLINSRSSAGVSFVSYALETASLLITLSYSVRNEFPFSTFGESALIAIQDVAIGILVLTFAGRSAAAVTFVAIVAASVYALLFDQTLINAQTMAYLQTGAGALGVASKLPQIYAIWSEGGTGQLSAFAVCPK